MLAQTLKGVSGDLIILEEAAYCDQQLIAEVVVPLLTVQSSVLICISTLLEGNNHYSRLFEIEDAAGNKMFETMQISLVCDECLKTDHPERSAIPQLRSSVSSRKKWAVSVTTARYADRHLTDARTSYLRCRAGSAPRRWTSSRPSLQKTQQCCFERAWALQQTRPTRPLRRRRWTRLLSAQRT